MFHKILVPTDLSGNESEAIQTAINLAEHNHASVCVLHVIETIHDTTFDELKSFYKQLEEKARGKLEEITQQFEEKKVACTSKVVYGSRAGAILEYANSNDIDLIILRSHIITPDIAGGQSSGWGTISYKVGILSQCPVLLVK